MNVEFVRADVLRNVQGRLIEKYGGLAGLRDEHALKSAIGRPRSLLDFGELIPFRSWVRHWRGRC